MCAVNLRKEGVMKHYILELGGEKGWYFDEARRYYYLHLGWWKREEVTVPIVGFENCRRRYVVVDEDGEIVYEGHSPRQQDLAIRRIEDQGRKPKAKEEEPILPPGEFVVETGEGGIRIKRSENVNVSDEDEGALVFFCGQGHIETGGKILVIKRRGRRVGGVVKMQMGDTLVIGGSVYRIDSAGLLSRRRKTGRKSYGRVVV